MGRVKTPKCNNDKNIMPGVYTIHRPQECYQMLNGKPIHRKPQKASEDKKTIKIISNDIIRELIVPEQKPIEQPAIVSKNELNRLKNKAKVITLKDRVTMCDEAQKETERLAEECELRKRKLNQLHAKPKGKHLTEVEIAEHKRTTHLLQRAYELQQENEIEVQNANRLILAAKCQAIRDAQLAEKELIEKEIEAEEKRLQEVQEQLNAKEYQKELEKRQAEQQKQQNYVKSVIQQIKEHEVKTLLDLERKDEEARIQNQILLQQQQEAERKRQEKLEQNRKALEEVRKVNENLKQLALLKKEEERISDLKVQEFLRKKAEREAAIAQEKRLIDEAKQKQRDRLYELQQRQMKLQETGDEISARRIQEEVERKWRQKEKEAALKRKEANEKLKRDRANQIMNLKRMQAMDMERDRSEFYKTIEIQKKLYEKELEEKKTRHEKNMKYRTELLCQINQKEKEKIAERKSLYEDGIALKLQHEKKDKEIKTYIKDKINKLRLVNAVPDRLVKDIECQLKI